MSEQSVWEQPVSAATKQKVLDLSRIDRDLDVSSFHVLDFGCGNGRYLEVFADWIPKSNLYGVEVDAVRVAQVRQKGLSCLPIDPKRSCLPFKDESFDVVFSSNVVEHIPRRLYLEYLPEIHRVLETGGRFVVGTPNYPIKRLYDLLKAVKTRHTLYYLFDDPTHINKMSMSRLERDLKNVFSDVQLDADHIPFQDSISWFRRPDIRRRLRVFGDKIVGYCTK